MDDVRVRVIRKDVIVDITDTLRLAAKEVKSEMGKRVCGDCTACCWVWGIKELDKQPRKFCSHQGQGCGIYPTRPQSCIDFKCLWLDGNIIEDELRPDRLGAMFSLRAFKGLANEQEIVWVHEIIDGALQRGIVQGAARYFAQHYPVMLMHLSGRREMMGPAPLTEPVMRSLHAEALQRKITIPKLLEW